MRQVDDTGARAAAVYRWREEAAVVRGVVTLVLAFIVGAALVAAFLSGRGTEDAPSRPVSGSETSTVTATAAGADAGTPGAGDGAPQMLAAQVAGMRGCGQPVFVTAGGLAPRARLRLERTDLAGTFVAVASKADGTVAVDARSLFSMNCRAGSEYTVRMTDVDGRTELATARVEMPLFRGMIEVDPTAGGCREVVVTVRGMPVNVPVWIVATNPAPFAHEGVSVLAQPLMTNDQGSAQSAAFEPPWSCDTPALSLTAFANDREASRTREAELLYRIALGADEPVPGVERWLGSIGP